MFDTLAGFDNHSTSFEISFEYWYSKVSSNNQIASIKNNRRFELGFKWLAKRDNLCCWTLKIPHFLNLTICQTKNAAAFFRSLSAPVLFLDLTTWLYVYIRVTLGPTDLVFYCRWTIYERNICVMSIRIRLNVNLFLKYTSALKIQIVRFSFKMHGSKQRLLPDDPENALGSSLFNKVIHHPITELQQTSYFWGYADWFMIIIWKDLSLFWILFNCKISQNA